MNSTTSTMKKSQLAYINQDRQALYSKDGIFITLVKYYRWQTFSFQTISHPNSEVVRELIGEIKVESTSIEQFDLMENTRFWWRTKDQSWSSHYKIKLIPNQALTSDLEDWIEKWLTLPLIPFIRYKKSLMLFSFQFKRQPTESEICQAMELIEYLSNYIKKASFE